MEVHTSTDLQQQKCKPCEGGVEPCPLPVAKQQLAELNGWELIRDGQRIRKAWRMKNFLQGLSFFEKVGVVAETDAHHPDLHLENYRDVSIELWTHAIGGLSENDFILAAKIDQVAAEFVKK